MGTTGLWLQNPMVNQQEPRNNNLTRGKKIHTNSRKKITILFKSGRLHHAGGAMHADGRPIARYIGENLRCGTNN